MQLLAHDLGERELQPAIDFTLHFLRVARDPAHLWRMLDTVKPLKQGELPFAENFQAEGLGRKRTACHTDAGEL